MWWNIDKQRKTVECWYFTLIYHTHISILIDVFSELHNFKIICWKDFLFVMKNQVRYWLCFYAELFKPGWRIFWTHSIKALTWYMGNTCAHITNICNVYFWMGNRQKLSKSMRCATDGCIDTYAFVFTFFININMTAERYNKVFISLYRVLNIGN